LCLKASSSWAFFLAHSKIVLSAVMKYAAMDAVNQPPSDVKQDEFKHFASIVKGKRNNAFHLQVDQQPKD